jgi:hypothetical protein
MIARAAACASGSPIKGFATGIIFRSSDMNPLS